MLPPRRRDLLALPALAFAPPRTEIAIDGESFLINGRLTYPGRKYRGMRIEGLLLNARVVQGIFDDRNPETRSRWKYPDTGRWDPDRNTSEFVRAMPEWRRAGLLGFTINLQGGSPEGYSKQQPWHNSAFGADGVLDARYLSRLKLILDHADSLGMVPIVGLFYFGQDQHVANETAVKRAVENAARWLLKEGYRNALLEIANECDIRDYDHDILKPPRIHELIELAKGIRANGRRLLVGTSFAGNSLPTPNVVAASDFVLLHGNSVRDPFRIAEMVRQVRQGPRWRPMPILFNEDDHFDFERPTNNMISALSEYASWGYFDPGRSDYSDGYQCPPVNWGINTERKRAFFRLLKEVSGE